MQDSLSDIFDEVKKRIVAIERELKGFSYKFEVNNMTEGKEGRKPDFKGKVDVAAWKNKTKEGDDYLALTIGGVRINLFKNEPKP